MKGARQIFVSIPTPLVIRIRQADRMPPLANISSPNNLDVTDVAIHKVDIVLGILE
jgi:hypothetical protein